MSNRTLLVIVAVVAAISLVGILGAPGMADDGSNETSEHERPDEAQDDSEEGAVSEWLQGQLDERLGESAVLLNERQYDAARDQVGDEYDEHLERYAELEDEIEDEDEDEDEDVEEELRSTEEFEEARDNQRNITDDVETYDRTYEEYQEAVEEGDDERARELARDLDELADSIEEGSQRADEEFDRIESETDRDVSTARDSIESVRADIENRQSEVRDREFEGTELSVEGEPTAISFNEPMTLSGTVMTEDGEPVANEPIALEIEGQRIEATTSATGSFSVSYRPTVLPLETTELDVEYVPPRGSPYDGSNASVDVAVEQVDSEIEVTEYNETAAFEDNLTVDGTVSAEEIPADAVPVSLIIEGEEYASGVTDGDGTFALNATLPAGVPLEEPDIRVVTDLEDRALGNSETDVPVRIEETPSVLEMRIEPTGEHGAIVGGELTTVDGVPVAGQTIVIDVEGEETTVETTEGGTFEQSVTLPDDRSSATVTVTYADSSSNIEDAEESVTIDLGEGGATGFVGSLFEGLPFSVSVESLGLFVLVVLGSVSLTIGAYRLYQLRRAGRAATTSGSKGPRGQVSDTGVIRVLLSLARDRLREGETDRAVELAYVAARLGVGHGPSESQTHWEFYDSCLSDGFSSEELRRLESLTTQYEVAAFAPEMSQESAANEALRDAEQLAE